MKFTAKSLSLKSPHRNRQIATSFLTLLLGRQEEQPPVKELSDGDADVVIAVEEKAVKLVIDSMNLFVHVKRGLLRRSRLSNLAHSGCAVLVSAENWSSFFRSDVSPVTQSTASKNCRELKAVS